MTETVRIRKAEKYAVSQRALSDKTRDFFMQNFGCSRKVYNLYVDWLYTKLEETNYTGGTRIPAIKLPEVTEFKKSFEYLKDADSLGLANAKISFEKALQHFNEECDHKTYTKGALSRDRSGTEKLSFRGLVGMPRFHSKAHGDFSYTTNCQYPTETGKLKRPTIRLEKNRLYLPKLKDGVELIVHRPLPKDAKIGNVTISMDPSGQIYVSVEYECVIVRSTDLLRAVLEGDRNVLDHLHVLGLDYSQENFYIDSEGRKANYPHFYRESEAKLAREQKKLSRMTKGSSNYRKQLLKIQKTGAKIRNQRKDFINKEALRLSEEYDAVAVEDLDLRNLSKSLRLGKNLHDNGFGQFRNRLENKLRDKGSVLVKIDRFYPSTKTCHCCGYYNEEIRLGITKWICPGCGTELDRDENAAINIRDEGKRSFADYYKTVLKKEEQVNERAVQRSDFRHRKRT